jgi:hypothetical protein
MEDGSSAADPSSPKTMGEYRRPLVFRLIFLLSILLET